MNFYGNFGIAKVVQNMFGCFVAVIALVISVQTTVVQRYFI